MEILYLMVPLGMVLVGLGVWAFFWAVGSGQFDDLDSPGWTVLDDETRRTPRDGDAHAGADDDAASHPTEPPR